MPATERRERGRREERGADEHGCSSGEVGWRSGRASYGLTRFFFSCAGSACLLRRFFLVRQAPGDRQPRNRPRVGSFRVRPITVRYRSGSFQRCVLVWNLGFCATASAGSESRLSGALLAVRQRSMLAGAWFLYLASFTSDRYLGIRWELLTELVFAFSSVPRCRG